MIPPGQHPHRLRLYPTKKYPYKTASAQPFVVYSYTYRGVWYWRSGVVEVEIEWQYPHSLKAWFVGQSAKNYGEERVLLNEENRRLIQADFEKQKDYFRAMHK